MSFNIPSTFRFSLLFLLLFPIFSFSFAQISAFPVLESQRFFGGEGNDIPKKLVLATDTSIVIGGYSFSVEENNCTDVRIVKIDTSGKVLWDKLLEMGGCQELRGMTAIEDGGIIFVGVTNAGIEHEEHGDAQFQSDGWVGRMDKKGNLLWLKTYGGKEVDIANAVQVEGQDVFVVGTSFSNDKDVLLNHGGSDIWGFRIAKEGDLRFLKTIGGTGNEWAQSISACKNGDYVIAGFTNSPELSMDNPVNRNGNALLIRIKKSGTTVWAKTFPAEFGGNFQAVTEDSLGNLVVVGSFLLTPDNAQYWFLKLTETGTILQDKKWGSVNDEYFTCIEVCHDNTYLLGGYSRFRGANDAYTKGKDDFTVFKLNQIGDIIWRKTFGGPDYERCADICEYAPNKFLLVGEKDNYFTGKKDGNKDFWLLKLKELPCDSATIKPDIFVRADEKGSVFTNQAVRFRARNEHGETFFWDFGDGTTSTEAQPLKTYRTPGIYDIKLIISINETCRQVVVLPAPLIVKE